MCIISSLIPTVRNFKHVVNFLFKLNILFKTLNREYNHITDILSKMLNTVKKQEYKENINIVKNTLDF